MHLPHSNYRKETSETIVVCSTGPVLTHLIYLLDGHVL